MDPRAALPAVDKLLTEEEALAPELERWRWDVVVAVARGVLDGARAEIAAGGAAPERRALVRRIRERLAALALPRPRRVINATGVVIHTNLGRAPLAPAAVRATAEAAGHYSNLEYDIEPGRRGHRSNHVSDLLELLFPGKKALVVNNNAATVLLALQTFARGREVIISRGELIEIGGSFRIPEILECSGALLHEVGTTNRTHLRDFENALSDETGLVLKVWPSNYRVVGFTKEVALGELVTLAHARGVPVVADQGCGRLFRDSPGPKGEPSVEELLATGADVVTFSGDKMLGGPQAGVLVGTPEAIAACAKNPLTRALRPDKMTLAALATTCQLLLRNGGREQIPAAGMLDADLPTLKRRAQGLARAIRSQLPELELEVISGASRVGGGAAPEEDLPTWLVAVRPPGGEEKVATALRRQDPPVVVRTLEGRLLIDPRTLLPGEAKLIAGALARALG